MGWISRGKSNTSGTSVTGSIRLKTPQAVKYWAGLVNEQIAWMQDNLGTQTITVTPVSPTGTIQITNITLTPTTINAGQLLNEKIPKSSVERAVEFVFASQKDATAEKEDERGGFWNGTRCHGEAA